MSTSLTGLYADIGLWNR